VRTLTARDEAALRAIAEQHGYLAERGPHAREGSSSRLVDALVAGELMTGADNDSLVLSGKRDALRRPSPLRTGRAALTASGSSTHEPSRTMASNAWTGLAGCTVTVSPHHW
jgi:hypothetical protein